jgi:hypothetical protein
VKKRIYIAGPMTGLPEYNYPAFNAEAKRLRALGWEVENPAENEAPSSGEWIDFMRLAIPQLMTCDIIVLLPGWIESRGARIEVRVSEIMGLLRAHAGAITWHPLSDAAPGVLEAAA